jgi:hypothetical protein
MMRLMFLVAAVLVPSVSLQANDWGSIRGQIVVEGEIPERPLLIAKGANIKDKEVCAAEDHYAEDLIIDKDSKGLANVFVYLAKKPKSIHPDLIEPTTEAVPVTYKGCQLVPHCLICRTNQRLEIGSDDGLAHSPHIRPPKNHALGSLVPPNSSFKLEVQLRKAEALPFKASCDYHAWITGYWLIVDHPYAAITDKDGRFSIDKLPVGELQFKIWHETAGYVESKYKVTVAAGEPVELPIMKLDITRLQKPPESK